MKLHTFGLRVIAETPAQFQAGKKLTVDGGGTLAISRESDYVTILPRSEIENDVRLNKALEVRDSPRKPPTSPDVASHTLLTL